MSKLIVQVSGGVVQDVFELKTMIHGSTSPINGVIIVDFDSEDDPSDNNLTRIYVNGQELVAHVHEESLHRLPAKCDVRKIVNAFLKENK